jgi:hypothetical protein
MANLRKAAPWIFQATGWLASVLPGVWGAMITTVGATVILWLTAGVAFFTSPAAIGTLTIATLILWTYVALVWLATRRQIDVKFLRYGVTFEGLTAVFTPGNRIDTLGFLIQLRNFTPVPLRYYVEEIDVRLETRTLPSRYVKDSLTSFLSRGAARTTSTISFRYEHVQEFFGRRVEGSLDFSIRYGDADRSPARRLRMSHKITIEFPDVDTTLPLPHLPILAQPVPVGFGAAITSESDEPI